MIQPQSSHPVLMSLPMILAIQKGWKKVTRRVAWPMPVDIDDPWPNNGSHVTFADILENVPYYVEAGHCRYGRVLDTLWIKETWQIIGWTNNYGRALVRYATHEPGEGNWINVPLDKSGWLQKQANTLKGKYKTESPTSGKYTLIPKPIPWKSNLFMPKWASRILLQIKRIDLELLQAINAAGAIAEGIDRNEAIRKLKAMNGSTWSPGTEANFYVEEYRTLWDSLQEHVEETGFDANPYVWVIDFEEVKNGSAQ